MSRRHDGLGASAYRDGFHQQKVNIVAFCLAFT